MHTTVQQVAADSMSRVKYIFFIPWCFCLVCICDSVNAFGHHAHKNHLQPHRERLGIVQLHCKLCSTGQNAVESTCFDIFSVWHPLNPFPRLTNSTDSFPVFPKHQFPAHHIQDYICTCTMWNPENSPTCHRVCPAFLNSEDLLHENTLKVGHQWQSKDVLLHCYLTSVWLAVSCPVKVLNNE